MFKNNIIEFSAQEDYFDLKEDYPIPATLNIPEWFKKLNHSISDRTVKGCMPFLDALTAGYILKMPQDLAIKHNVDGENGEKVIAQLSAAAMEPLYAHLKGCNLNINNLESHPPQQLGECPYHEQNKNMAYHKILNPWTIKTPPGYSCLFLPIMHNGDDRFFPLAGIVDTDAFPHEINFPIVINGYKYPVLDTVIKKGTPYVQVVPFKREKWKMTFSKRTTEQLFTSKMNYALKLIHNYKTRFWNKKSWK
jgi:hypothetical protein